MLIDPIESWMNDPFQAELNGFTPETTEEAVLFRASLAEIWKLRVGSEAGLSEMRIRPATEDEIAEMDRQLESELIEVLRAMELYERSAAVLN